MSNDMMRTFSRFTGAMALAGALVLGSATAAKAEDAEKPFKINGSVTIASDYRFRGVSQSDKAMAIQGGITVSHKSGLYAGTWASNLAGWGTFGGSNTELDIFGGYTHSFGAVTADVGLTWYMYPGGADLTDFAEPYIKLSTTQGPATVLLGVAYAPKQKALGNYSNTPESMGQKQDNTYVWTDMAMGIPGTPVKAKAHLGHSWGNPGLGPNGTSVAPTGSYTDWSLGAEYALGPVTLGVAWIDTDISTAKAAYLQPNFSSTKDGSSIAGSTVLVSATAAF